MTDEVLAAQEADDANLLNLVRTGDSDAFVILRQRHEQAALRLARELAGSAAEVNDLVEQTFAEVLDVTSHGGGPTDAFRPYLLTAIRQAGEDGPPAEGSDVPEERSLMAAAFFALPERWIAALWHAEIELASPVDVSSLLGLTPEGVAALRRRAREGLRQTYLQLHASRGSRPECRPVWEQLGAFIRDPAPGPEGAQVTEHLSQCDDCRALYTDLADVSLALRTLVAPVVLGQATPAYLSGMPYDTAAASAGAATGSGSTAGDAADAAWSGPRHAAWLSAPLARHSLQPLRLLGAAVVIVACGAGFAVSLAGHDTPRRPAHHPEAEVAATPVPTATLAPAPSHSASDSSPVASSRKPRSRPAGSRASITSPASVPRGPAVTTSAPPAVQLTASVSASVSGQHGHWHVAQVVFQVSNTGSAATRHMTVSITLPAGARMLGQGHGRGHWHSADTGQAGSGGWSCQPTDTGASCQHSKIPAGSQAQGAIYIWWHRSSACGQSVGLTATSRAASANAQSPQGLQC